MPATVAEPPAFSTRANELMRDLEARGWRIEMHLRWLAEASRGMDSEESVGPTPEDALRRLSELVRVYEVGHLP
jgi:hypothetical protein